MRKLFTCLFLLLAFATVQAQQKFDDFSKDFVKGYQDIHMPDLELSYVSGFEHIGSPESVQKQENFFKSMRSRLGVFKTSDLTPGQKTDYQLISYETSLNLERIALEKQWLKNKPDTISKKGIITIPNGKAWYAYLLKRWVNDEVTPEKIYQFCFGEV
jgi:hypothetical protein